MYNFLIIFFHKHMKSKPFKNMLYIDLHNINHFRFWHNWMFCTKRSLETVTGVNLLCTYSQYKKIDETKNSVEVFLIS